MRVADYLSFAWRGIVRQRVRTLLTVLALAIAATIVISLVSITVGAQRTITTERGLTEGLETMVVTPNAVVSTGLLGGSVQVANDKAEVSRASRTRCPWRGSMSCAGLPSTAPRPRSSRTPSPPAKARLTRSRCSSDAPPRPARKATPRWSSTARMWTRSG